MTNITKSEYPKLVSWLESKKIKEGILYHGWVTESSNIQISMRKEGKEEYILTNDFSEEYMQKMESQIFKNTLIEKFFYEKDMGTEENIYVWEHYDYYYHKILITLEENIEEENKA